MSAQLVNSGSKGVRVGQHKRRVGRKGTMQQSWHGAQVCRNHSLRSRCTETSMQHGTCETFWLQSMLDCLGQHI